MTQEFLPADPSVLARSLPQATLEKVITEAGEELSQMFRDGLKTLREMPGYRNPKPDIRLFMYVQRPVENWDLLKALDPEIWEEDMRDFEHLIENEQRRRTPKERAPAVTPPASQMYSQDGG